MAKRSAVESLGAFSKTGFDIAKSQYDVAMNKPNPKSIIGQHISNDAQKITWKKDKGRALLSGALEGVGLGLQLKGLFENKKEAEKFDKVMNYYSQVAEQATQDQAKFAEREKQKLVVQNSADSLGSFQMRNASAEQRQDFFRQFVLPDLVKAGVCQKGDSFSATTDPLVYVGTTADGQSKTVNILEYMSPEAIQNYKDRVQEGFQQQQIGIQQQNSAINQGHLDLAQKQQAAKDQEQQRLAQTRSQLGYGQILREDLADPKTYEKEIFTYGKLIDQNERAVKAIDKMDEVFDRNPNIGKSFSNLAAKWAKSDEGSFKAYLGRVMATGSKGGNQDFSDAQILMKNAADLNLDTVLGISGKNATDILKKTINAAAPNGDLSVQAFVGIAKDWKERALKSINYMKEKTKLYQNGIAMVGHNSYEVPEEDLALKSERHVTPSGMTQGATPSGMVMIKNTETGEVKPVSSDQAQLFSKNPKFQIIQ